MAKLVGTEAQERYRAYIGNAITKLENVNIDEANSRLEWVCEQNPDIDRQRLITPYEIQDMTRAIERGLYRSQLKFAGTTLGKAANFGALVAFDAFYAIKGDCSRPLSAFLLGLAVPLTIGGAVHVYYGTKALSSGIKNYLKFKKSKFSRILTQRERRLIDYIYMKDKSKGSKDNPNSKE